MAESKIEKAANKVLADEGWLVEKVKFLTNGYPDRAYLHLSGVLVWFEWKDVGKVPSDLQYIRLRDLRERGQFASWSDNVRDGVWFCRNALVAERIPSGRYQNATPTRGSSFVPGPWPWKDESSFSCTEGPQGPYVNQ